jgi:hypothetical protein
MRLQELVSQLTCRQHIMSVLLSATRYTIEAIGIDSFILLRMVQLVYAKLAVLQTEIRGQALMSDPNRQR